MLVKNVLCSLNCSFNLPELELVLDLVTVEAMAQTMAQAWELERAEPRAAVSATALAEGLVSETAKQMGLALVQNSAVVLA